MSLILASSKQFENTTDIKSENQSCPILSPGVPVKFLLRQNSLKTAQR